MRTTVYVDGYNLFYGVLKRTEHKWLDLNALLFDRIIRPETPEAALTQIRFYTADIKDQFATRGIEARTAQAHYHSALRSHLGDRIEIIKGYYFASKSKAIRYKKPPDKSDYDWAWRLEEKQTDVNIAIDAYRDASKHLVDQAVFVSNDNDLVPALKAIREDFGNQVRIGLISPLTEKRQRSVSASLQNLSHWTRRYIREDELKESHLPGVVLSTGKRRKPIIKPDYW